MAKANQGEALNWAHPDTSFFSDTFWLCQDVRDSDTYRTIADNQTAAMRAGNDDITSFFSPSKFQLCWRYLESYGTVAADGAFASPLQPVS